jgi:hypothetical protein
MVRTWKGVGSRDACTGTVLFLVQDGPMQAIPTPFVFFERKDSPSGMAWAMIV